MILQNDRLVKENEQLKNQANNTDYQIQQAVQAETGALVNEINALKDQVVQAGNQVVGNGNAQANPNAPLPINGATTGPQVETRGGINWVNPSDMPTTDSQGNALQSIGVNGAGIGFPKTFDNNVNDIRKSNDGLQSSTGNNAIFNTLHHFSQLPLIRL